MNLDGKTALITGGSRGLGREMAVAFAEAGVSAITLTAAAACDEDKPLIDAELQETKALVEKLGSAAHCVVADVASETDCVQSVSETIDKFGSLHILVNNAGKAGRYVHHGDGSLNLWDVNPKGFRDVIDTNVLGPFLMMHAAGKFISKEGWGRIINISKRTDSMHRKAITPYGPSKAALDAATIAWAEWLYDTGITVNTLSPGGAVDTKFGTGKIEGRGLDPKVIKKPSVWLASPASDGITGCRYVAERWDESLTPDEAAEGCREPVIFTTPERKTPLEKAWKESGKI